MGCGTYVIDKTCKKNFYCGYGSYGNFDERMKHVPEEHAKCELHGYSEDYTSYNKKNDSLDMLAGMYYEEPWILNFSEYEEIDCDPCREK